MSAPPSALLPPREPLLGWFVGSAVLHGVVAVGMVGLSMLNLATRPAEPLFEPDQVIEVALAPMPKAAIPQRATRQAVPKAVETPPTPEAPPEPPPPKASDMVFEDDEPEPVERKAAPEETTRPTRDVNVDMASLLDELAGADEGPKDRDAAGPDGQAGARPARVVGAGSGDPALRAYIARLSELFMAEFRPLPALKGQGLVATVLVKVNDAGAVKEAEVSASSGNPSYDRSALAAAQAVRTVPPPPEAFRDGTPRSYKIVFSD